MIKKYSEFLNEGILQHLTGPSDEQILNNLIDKYQNMDKLLDKSIDMEFYDGVKYALENDANANATDGFNRNFLYFVCKDEDIDILKLLIKYGINIHFDRDYALRTAAENKQEKVLKLLIKNGADVNAVEGEALRSACNVGNYEIAKILVDNNADIHVRDERPLKNAASVAYYKIIKMLLEHGADVTKIQEHAFKRMEDCKRFDCLDLINEYKNKVKS